MIPIVTIVILSLDLVLLVHQVILFSICRHVLLAHRVNLGIAIHLCLIGHPLVWVSRCSKFEFGLPQHLFQQAVQHLADAIAASLLQLCRDCIYLNPAILQGHQNVCNQRVRILVLLPVGLPTTVSQLQAPDDQLREISELVRCVCSGVREEGPRDRLQVLVAEPCLVIKQHEHVHDLIVELEHLCVVLSPIRAGGLGHGPAHQ
mmetsp:Transcript_103349/g.287734  ORF Transcript_103349/g.287734 Transcript_103349/m.287734 type:complete len:204 (-) Transcript_103349:52-663(-)